jgi:hypothetical protein
MDMNSTQTARIVLHRDGTVDYFSVYEQVWRRHQDCISDRELAAMSDRERIRVRVHLSLSQPQVSL